MCPAKWRLLRTLVNSLSPRHSEIGRRGRDSARDTSRERADLQRRRWHLLWGPKTSVTPTSWTATPSLLSPGPPREKWTAGNIERREVTAQTFLGSRLVWSLKLVQSRRLNGHPWSKPIMWITRNGARSPIVVKTGPGRLRSAVCVNTGQCPCFSSWETQFRKQEDFLRRGLSYFAMRRWVRICSHWNIPAKSQDLSFFSH